VNKLLTQYNYFKQGICVVHHMFGGEVTEKVKTDYPLEGKPDGDANTFYTAHFEVPGEMFEIATNAQSEGKGVVGSTSNILNFIVDKAKEPCDNSGDSKRFILGTESGMITGIVKNVQDVLREGKMKRNRNNDTLDMIWVILYGLQNMLRDSILTIVSPYNTLSSYH
jgi:quinolinate synthase